MEKIEPHWLDFVPQEDGESISTILYHLAAIEASWLYEEILQLPFPPEIEALLPYDVREANGKLTPVNDPMPEHWNRLAQVREQLLHAFSSMSVDDFKKLHTLPEYDVSPMYVLHHLMQHEAEHRSQINAVAMQAKVRLGTENPKEKL